MYVKSQDLTQIYQVVKAKTGLVFSEDKQIDVKDAVQKTIDKFKFPNLDAFLEKITYATITTPEFIFFVEQLTINETYFFRHFNTIEQHVLPELVRSKKNKKLRIWSAGCSSGEEPYTIAMVLNELIPDLDAWEIRIKATDIDTQVLNIARNGIYKNWSMRQIRDYFKHTYFKQISPMRYEVDSRLRRLIQFEQHNLLINDYPSSLNQTDNLDLVICRNVTIYFDTQDTIKIIERFYKCLRDGGYLIVGHSEPSPFIYDRFNHQIIGDMVVYQKNESEAVKPRPTFISLDSDTSTQRAQPKTPKKRELNLRHIDLNKSTPSATPVERRGREEVKPVLSSIELELIQENFVDACKLFESHQYDDARKLLSNNLMRDSTHIESNYLMALIYANLHDFSSATPHLLTVIQHDSLHEESYYLLALMQREERKYDTAIENLKKALYINPDFILVYYELIVNYVLLEQRTQAEDEYRRLKDVLKDRNDDEDVGIIDNLKIRNVKDLVCSFLDLPEF